MESPCTGTHSFLFNLNLSPAQCIEIKDPKIIEVTYSLSPKDNKVGIEELWSMVSPFPRSSLIVFGCYLHPLLTWPIQNIDTVESFLICASPSKENDPSVDLVITHGAVGAMGGYIACCLDLPPLHSDGVERPDIIHVVWILNSGDEYLHSLRRLQPSHR